MKSWPIMVLVGWLAFFTGSAIIRPAHCAQFSSVLETALGYDDNLTQTQAAVGSGFATLKMDLSGRIFPAKHLDVSVYLNDQYQDYLDAGNNNQVSVGAAMDVTLMRGYLVPGLFIGGRFYTDEEIPQDNLQEIGLGGNLQWIAGPSLTLTGRMACFRRLYPDTDDTREASGFHVGHGGSAADGAGREDQDDLLWELAADALWYASPDVDAGANLFFRHNGSNYPGEAFDSLGAGIELRRRFLSNWDMWGRLGMTHVGYEHVSGQETRIDWNSSLEIGICRSLASFEVFTTLGWEANTSTLETQDYEQMVTQCGIRRAF